MLNILIHFYTLEISDAFECEFDVFYLFWVRSVQTHLQTFSFLFWAFLQIIVDIWILLILVRKIIYELWVVTFTLFCQLWEHLMQSTQIILQNII